MMSPTPVILRGRKHVCALRATDHHPVRGDGVGVPERFSNALGWYMGLVYEWNRSLWINHARPNGAKHAIHSERVNYVFAAAVLVQHLAQTRITRHLLHVCDHEHQRRIPEDFGVARHPVRRSFHRTVQSRAELAARHPV